VDLASQTVLVTGAGGFIGSHLTERLVSLGAKTRAMVRYTSTGTWGWLDDSPAKGDIEVVQGDVRDRDSVGRAVRGVDVVFHLAALVAIPYSYQAPLSYVRTNVEGTLNVLQESLDNNVKAVVHTSTSEVYGTAQYVPMDEEHPLQGPVSVLCYQDRGGQALRGVPPFVRASGDGPASLQHFRTAAVGPRRDTDVNYPGVDTADCQAGESGSHS